MAKSCFLSLDFASYQTEEVATQQEDGAAGKKKRKKKKKKVKGEDAEAESEEAVIYQKPPKFEVNNNCLFYFCVFLVQFKTKT